VREKEIEKRKYTRRERERGKREIYKNFSKTRAWLTIS